MRLWDPVCLRQLRLQGGVMLCYQRALHPPAPHLSPQREGGQLAVGGESDSAGGRDEVSAVSYAFCAVNESMPASPLSIPEPQPGSGMWALDKGGQVTAPSPGAVQAQVMKVMEPQIRVPSELV